MVGIAQKTSGGVGGVGGGHIPWAGHFYSMANIIANNTAEVFVPADLAGARQSFAGLSTNLNSDDSIGILLRSSAIKATIDTLLETSGWINVTQEEATQAGTGRHWPAMGSSDQGPAPGRHARAGSIDRAYCRDRLQHRPRQCDCPVGATWQAEAAVRDVEDSRRPPAGEAGEAAPT
jgi:hypothetical protein